MNIGSILNVNKENAAHTNLVFVAQANLKGWIPGWAISGASDTQGYMVLRVKEHFAPKLAGKKATTLMGNTNEWMIFMGAAGLAPV